MMANNNPAQQQFINNQSQRRSNPVSKPAAQKPANSIEDKLSTLKKLNERGLITDEEFKESKKEILKELYK